MKTRHLLMLAALPVAAWLAFFGDKTPSGAVAEPAERSVANASTGANTGANAQRALTASDNSGAGSPAAERTGGAKPKRKAEIAVLALRNRAELIGGASSGGTSGLFGQQSWAPPPPPPVKPGPPPAPTAPAVPFTFLGKKHEDAAWEVYLAHGDTTLIVHEQSTIEGTYRVDSIKPPLLTLTYLPLNQSQTLPIGDAD